MKTAAGHGLVAAAWAILTLGVLATGCGKGAPGRVPLWGTVAAAEGQPMDGSITFLPKKGSRGPAATTRLVAGQYRFDWDSGPTAGPHQVIISQRIGKELALRALPQRAKSPSAKEAGGGGRKTEWTLAADVPAAPPYRCDLKLAP
jgi:hypothetical protein